MKLSSIFRFIKSVNPWKTIIFNFHYFPFRVAVKLPFFIYWRSDLYIMKGSISINAPITTGMVKFGVHSLGTRDTFYSRTMWDVSGTLIIGGIANIGRGTKISIGKDGILNLGDNFTITGDSEIICQHNVSFGNGCLLSWNILIMDTDFHQIMDRSNSIINNPKAIRIGNHVWIGCRNTILKGSDIADNIIVSANSTITRKFSDPNCIIGGNGKYCHVIKTDVMWKI